MPPLVPVALSSLKPLLACCSDLSGSNDVPQVHSSFSLNVIICLTLQSEVPFYGAWWAVTCLIHFYGNLVSNLCPFICNLEIL
jgi:hypothetical protein